MEKEFTGWLESLLQSREVSKRYGSKKGTYMHFDFPLNRLESKKLWKICKPSSVESRGFYPLIRSYRTKIKRRNIEVEIDNGDKILKRKMYKERRPIDMASHADSLVYSWYARQLSNKYEASLEHSPFNESVIGYRALGKHGDNLHLAKGVIDFIQEQDEVLVIAADFHRFFETLNHQKIKQSWMQLLDVTELPNDHYNVFKHTIRTGVIEKGTVLRLLKKNTCPTVKGRYCYPDVFRKVIAPHVESFIKKREAREKIQEPQGIPQGLPISAIIANMYMMEFDTCLYQEVTNVGGIYRRYSDDVLIACPVRYRDQIMKILVQNTDLAKLEIKQEKLQEVVFQRESKTSHDCIDYDTKEKTNGFIYLGVCFDGKKVWLRHKSIAKMQRQLSRSVKNAKFWSLKKRVNMPIRFLIKKFTATDTTRRNFAGYREKAIGTFGKSSFHQQASDTKILSFMNRVFHAKKKRK